MENTVDKNIIEVNLIFIGNEAELRKGIQESSSLSIYLQLAFYI